MPPKRVKRKRQLMEERKRGREATKQLRLSITSSVRDQTTGTGGASSSCAGGLCQDSSGLEVAMGAGSGTSTSPKKSEFRPTLANPTGSARPEDILKTFSEQWKTTLDQEDLKSLALFLCHIFTTELEMTHSRAAKHAAKVIGKTDRTIRQWRSDLTTYGEVRESRKGKYERPKVLWANKELNDKARAFVQANTAFMVQGKQSTMKVKDFCQWVNETLLPNQAMASLYSFVPGYGYAPAPTSTNQAPLPQKISLETARKWLRELGF